MAVDHAFRKLMRQRITKLGRDEYGFTPAEVRVLTEICFGEPVSRIAEKLKMAPGTVSTHIRSMFKRSGIHAKAQLISKTLVALLYSEIRGK